MSPQYRLPSNPSALIKSETSLRSLTVSVLGAGNMGICLAKAFCKISGVTIKHIYSQTLARARSLAQQVGAEPLDHTDIIFGDKEVDVVALCLPTHTRLQTLKSAIQAQKHVFSEKPLALNRAVADEIRELLQGYPKTVMVGQVLRFFWEYSRLRQMVQSGAIGQIGTVRLSRCVGYPGSESWFADPEKSGGVILDLLVHDIDFLLWTFGDVKQVYAKSFTDSHRGRLDYALLNIQMQSGALAHIEGSWAHPVGSFRQTAEVCGSQGMLYYDNLASKGIEWIPTGASGDTSGSRIFVPETDDDRGPYLAEVAHFIDCVRSHRLPDVTYEEALKSCEVAFVAMESARLGTPLPFDK
jgi:UDP-N-acetylglucosamine 3-dehydrogenase